MIYDLAIIGAGWAGFNAALRAKALGKSVCLIEKGRIGGTCLNQGCIPTKVLIQSAKLFSSIKKSKNFGIDCPDARLELAGVQARKDSIITALGQGMSYLLKGVDLVSGHAAFLSPDQVDIEGAGKISARNFIIASGSRPYELAGLKFDGKKILSSDHLLRLEKLPGDLLIVGAGAIGCEFASLFNAFGTKVKIVEKMPQLLPGVDMQIGKKLAAVFKKKGIEVETGAECSDKDIDSSEVALVAVGRSPNIEGLSLEKAGVTVEAGRICVDETLKTASANVHACGDCASTLLLAHYASRQGRLAVENIFTARQKKTSSRSIPNCVFSDPEIACVGISEDTAGLRGIKVKVSLTHFMANGMARILDETDGFLKIVSDAADGKVIGASIIGPRATELISGLTIAVENGLTLGALRETVFAHPTLSEILAETA